MKFCLALSLGLTGLFSLLSGSARADEQFQNCLSNHWETYSNCATEAFSDTGTNIFRGAAAGALGGAAAGGFTGTGALPGAAAGGAAGGVGAATLEGFEQINCAVGYITSVHTCNWQLAPQGDQSDSPYTSYPPMTPDPYFQNGRDTNGDGLPDQSYPYDFSGYGNYF